MAVNIKLWAAILACSLACEADTVTSRDSRSWNGSVLQLKGGVLALSAHFPSGAPVSLQFGPNSLRAIEFNPTTFNPGAAPKLAGVSGGALTGTIYLRDKSGHKCGNITIDAQTVACSAGSWPRANTLRIIFDAQ
jgi:hypothetical protein